MKQFTSETQKTGELGEKICAAYLIKKSFDIIDQNYTTASGEIDIIAKKDSKLYFIEVKSIQQNSNVSYETYNPAQNLTEKKLVKIQKTVKNYLSEHNVSYETLWQIDLYCVYIDTVKSKHKLSVIENIILEK